jgi:TPR repeat protein
MIEPSSPAEWLRSAAAGNNRESLFLLGWAHEHGLHGLPVDAAQAAHWYRQAADSNVAAAHDRLARLYEHGTGVDQSALRAYAHAKRAASLGLAPSMFYVGMLTLLGVGVAPSASEAQTWFRRAADAGVPAAQDLLSAIEEQEPVPFDEQRAAADAGDANAMYWVGSRLLDGEGCAHDVNAAAQYLDRAARAGVWAAAMQLSMFYGLGAKGLERDARLSDEYLQLAEALRATPVPQLNAPQPTPPHR